MNEVVHTFALNSTILLFSCCFSFSICCFLSIKLHKNLFEWFLDFISKHFSHYICIFYFNPKLLWHTNKFPLLHLYWDYQSLQALIYSQCWAFQKLNKWKTKNMIKIIVIKRWWKKESVGGFLLYCDYSPTFISLSFSHTCCAWRLVHWAHYWSQQVHDHCCSTIRSWGVLK